MQSLQTKSASFVQQQLKYTDSVTEGLSGADARGSDHKH